MSVGEYKKHRTEIQKTLDENIDKIIESATAILAKYKEPDKQPDPKFKMLEHETKNTLCKKEIFRFNVTKKDIPVAQQPETTQEIKHGGNPYDS